MVIGPAPGPAPAAHARVITSSVTRSSWRTLPKVKLRKKVPSVDGAITRWPRTSSVEAQRKTSASSMKSPPATIECTRVITLRPGRKWPGRLPRSTQSLITASRPRCWASVAVSTRPAEATAWSSSKATARASRLCDACIGKVLRSWGPRMRPLTTFSQVGAPFPRMLSRFLLHICGGSRLSARSSGAHQGGGTCGGGRAPRLAQARHRRSPCAHGSLRRTAAR